MLTENQIDNIIKHIRNIKSEWQLKEIEPAIPDSRLHVVYKGIHRATNLNVSKANPKLLFAFFETLSNETNGLSPEVLEELTKFDINAYHLSDDEQKDLVQCGKVKLAQVDENDFLKMAHSGLEGWQIKIIQRGYTSSFYIGYASYNPYYDYAGIHDYEIDKLINAAKAGALPQELKKMLASFRHM